VVHGERESNASVRPTFSIVLLHSLMGSGVQASRTVSADAGANTRGWLANHPSTTVKSKTCHYEGAYTLGSPADLRVTRTVHGSTGIHWMIAKTIVRG
jgi:hypothetical protein